MLLKMTRQNNLRVPRLMSVCAFASLLACASLFAQDQRAASSRAATVLDSMPRAKRISQVALSPDGTQVAYIVKGELAVVAVSGGPSRMIALEGKLPIRDAVWS